MGDPIYEGSGWHPDQISQRIAEEELYKNRQRAFILWRERSPVDLYLSYIDLNHAVHHLPVKKLGKMFFFEGLKFLTLSNLVIYHLTLQEHLNASAELAGLQTVLDIGFYSLFLMPPDPINIMKLCILYLESFEDSLEATHLALVDMRPSLPGNTEFCVRRGDLLAEIRCLENRWLLAKHISTQIVAFFDLKQTAFLNDMDKNPDGLPYFHRTPSDSLIQLLHLGGCGSFLLRPSRRSSAFTLLVHTGNQIEKFLIECAAPPAEFSFILSTRHFHAISDIIHRYSARPIVGNCRLLHAVLCEGGPPVGEISALALRDCCASYSAASSSLPQPVVVASALAMCRTSEEKEWQKCALTLFIQNGRAVLEMDDPVSGNRSRMSLSEWEFLCLHESVTGRVASALLSTVFSASSQSSRVFLSFDSHDFYFTWIHHLREHTVQPLPVLNPTISFFSAANEFSVLYIYIDKFKGEGIPKGAESGCRIRVAVNGIAVASSPTQLPSSSSSTVFDNHIAILSVPRKCDVQLTLWSGVVGGKAVGGAKGGDRSLAVSALYQATVDSRFNSSPPFFFSANRHSFRILPMDAYSKLLQWLESVDSVVSLCEWASSRLSPPQRYLLCTVIVTTAGLGRLDRLFSAALSRSLSSSNPDVLLRQDSFGCCLVSVALRLAGRCPLENGLQSLFSASKREKDPEEEEVTEMLVLVGRQEKVLGVLFSLCRLVESTSGGVEESHRVRRVLVSSFVLRFANPLVLHISGCSQLARSIQNAANLAASPSFQEDLSYNSSASKLFRFFEYVRLSSQTANTTDEKAVVVEEQAALLCHLLWLALDTSVSSPSTSLSASTHSSFTTTSSPFSSLHSSMASSSSSYHLPTQNVQPPKFPQAIADLVTIHQSY